MPKALDLIKSFKWNSIFFKYIRYLTIIIIIPFMLLNMAIYVYYNQTLNTEIEVSLQQSMVKTSSNIENALDQIDKYYYLTNANPSTTIFLKKNISNYTGEDLSKLTSNIYNLMISFLNTTDYVNSIHIYSVVNDYVLSTRNSNSLENFYYKAWYDTYKSTNKNYFIMQSKSNYNGKDTNLISLCYGFVDNSGLYGMLIVDISADEFEKLFNSSGSSIHNSVFLIGDDAATLYSNDTNGLDNSLVSDIMNRTNIDNYLIFKDKKQMLCATKISNRELTIVSSVTMEQFAGRSKSIKNIIIIWIAATIIFAMFLAFLGSLKLYHSIVNVIARISSPSINDKGESNKEYNELLYLSDNMIAVMNNQKDIENMLVDKVEKLKKAQSIALQTQISPHFLFNTLNLVNGYILEISKGNNMATKLISLLSELLNTSLNTKDYLFTVNQEVEFAQKYVEIECIKHKNKFEVVWDIDCNTCHLKTVKMVLQPLIENAIEHGIKMLIKQKGRLVISSKIENKTLLLSVYDNYEIPEFKLNEIRNNLNNSELHENEHLGLSNVNQRIKLIFGSEYGCFISSDSSGTTVTLKMPLT